MGRICIIKVEYIWEKKGGGQFDTFGDFVTWGSSGESWGEEEPHWHEWVDEHSEHLQLCLPNILCFYWKK